MEWLAVSLVLSVVLTILVNIGLRLFPGAGDRAARRMSELASSTARDDRGMRVVVPWKAMLVASLVLTVALNLLLLLV